MTRAGGREERLGDRPPEGLGDDPGMPQTATIPQVLDRIADQFGEHDALVTPDRRLTFAELRHEVRRAAAAMIDLGVRAGDRIAIWSPNTWHWMVACLATTYAGGVLVPACAPPTAEETRAASSGRAGAAPSVASPVRA